MGQEPLLEVQGLSTSFFTQEGTVKAVQGVSFTLRPGEVLGIVGESGSGKTVTALSILGLVPYPGRVVAGTVHYKGRDLLHTPREELRRLRGQEIAMIFQDPIASLNPLLTIGEQVGEVLLAHGDLSPQGVRERTLDALRGVGLPDPHRIMASYPFQMSGGMCQRVMLAMMLMLEPNLLIADEPTSSLDTTLQAEMLERMRSLREKGTAIILITHSMGVVARIADRVLVMYAGRTLEHASAPALFHRPAHPYTWALLSAVPRLDEPARPLRPLTGSPPDLKDPPDECPFLARCHKAAVRCRTSPMPPLEEIEPAHPVACYNPVWQEGREAR